MKTEYSDRLLESHNCSGRISFGQPVGAVCPVRERMIVFSIESSVRIWREDCTDLGVAHRANDLFFYYWRNAGRLSYLDDKLNRSSGLHSVSLQHMRAVSVTSSAAETSALV